MGSNPTSSAIHEQKWALLREQSHRELRRVLLAPSLLPLLSGKETEFRPWALCEYRHSGFATDPLIMTTMLRYENWKLVVWHGDPACGNTRDGEMYDLSQDPDELNNLFHAPEHAQQRRVMKDMLLVAMTEAEDRTEPRVRPH